jgi:hypothetical protein
MNTLNYDLNLCELRRGDNTLSSGLKPEFSFTYDSLKYTSVTNDVSIYHLDDVGYELSAAESAEVAAYIETIVEDEIATANFRARDFLRQTDWYIVRQMETGQAVPVHVLADRAEAREDIVDDGE